MMIILRIVSRLWLFMETAGSLWGDHLQIDKDYTYFIIQIEQKAEAWRYLKWNITYGLMASWVL